MSRRHRERREARLRRDRTTSGRRLRSEQKDAPRIQELEDRLRQLSDGAFETSGNLPPDTREAHLEHILAFESVSSGTSLFQGLEANGVKLPEPEKLDEQQSVEKIAEVFDALAGLGVFLIGFGHLGPREFYSTLWNETLWEGCYVENRTPGFVTFIDVSHGMSRSDWHRFMEDLKSSESAQ